jgi:Peptidase A4 family
MHVRQYRASLLAAATVGALAVSLAISGPAGASVQAHHGHPGGGGRRIAASPPPGLLTPSIAAATAAYSTNWSGYAQAVSTSTGPYKAVVSTWKVPTVTEPKTGDQYSSDWVGVDGFSNSTLVQCGTEADNIGGTAVYDAWTEILPANEVVISGLTIHPGDTIMAYVKEISANRWRMNVTDETTGVSGGRTVSYTTPMTSAEVVHERPTVGSSLASLAKTSNVTQDPAFYSTTINTTPAIPLMNAASGATVYQMFMVNSADTAIIASPSKPDSDNDGFTVADGATSPPPPSS